MTGSLNLLKEQSERAWGMAKDSQLTEEEWIKLDQEDSEVDSNGNE